MRRRAPSSRTPTREARGTNKGAGRLVVLHIDAGQLGARRPFTRLARSVFEATAYATDRPVAPKTPPFGNYGTLASKKPKKKSQAALSDSAGTLLFLFEPVPVLQHTSGANPLISGAFSELCGATTSWT